MRVQSCRECQLFHRPQPSIPYGNWRVPDQLGQVIGQDFMGPFPERKLGKNQLVLTIVDMLTRQGAAWAVKGACAEEILGSLTQRVRTRGIPFVI